jgi:hypothetical protein
VLFVGALVCGLGSARAQAAPSAEPPVTETSSGSGPNSRGKRELVAGVTFLSLGFAAELSGAVIAVSCVPGQWCGRGFALSVGPPEGPTRYTLVSTGSSGAYIGGRIVAAPFLISGFTLAITAASKLATHRQVSQRSAWALTGVGLGMLGLSRLARILFLATGTCQSPLCAHGFDQASLWAGRTLTFTGVGLLVSKRRRQDSSVMLGGGPASSYGLSVRGRF